VFAKLQYHLDAIAVLSSGDAQDTVCASATNPCLQPVIGNVNSEAHPDYLLDMGIGNAPGRSARYMVNTTFSTSLWSEDSISGFPESSYNGPGIDNCFEILQTNIATPLPGPYNTLWIPDARTLWSRA
jgi:hypothetical protein